MADFSGMIKAIKDWAVGKFLTEVPIAGADKIGGVKADGTTTTIDSDGTIHASGGGESGTSDYNALSNKPSIGGVTLSGNRTLDELGIQPKGNYLTEVPEEYVTEEELAAKGYISEVPEEYVNQTEMEEYAQPKGNYLTEETDPTVPSWAKEDTKPTYSKSEVGLGNVPNVSTNNQTPTFEEATERVNIASGEKMSVLFGKIMKWFTDLKPHAFVTPITDLLATVAGSALDATMGKALDDKITANTTAIEEVNSSLSVKTLNNENVLTITYDGITLLTTRAHIQGDICTINGYMKIPQTLSLTSTTVIGTLTEEVRPLYDTFALCGAWGGRGNAHALFSANGNFSFAIQDPLGTNEDLTMDMYFNVTYRLKQ